jgi:5-methylcytosine-specific restriction enzyme subunit McrC
MKIIEIFENETVIIEDDDVKELYQIKIHSPNLPFNIIENKLTTNDYTIGEIQLKNKLIRIKPRHKTLSLNHYFEMLLYIDNINNNSIKSISYSNENTFGINGLIDNFISISSELISYGLTGVFSPKKIKTFKPKGKIVFSEYNKKLVPIEGISSLIDDYKLDNHANQIIKKALLKINEYSNLNEKHKFEISKILNYFTNVSEYQKPNENIKYEILNFSSTNPHYPICLEYAFKIILDLKLGYSTDNNIQWNAFLENSNDTFEKYVRKILERELTQKVNKWESPKKFAEINWNQQLGLKSFSPDIIVDYIDGRAKAVFDVKNKYFSPSENNPSELTSVSDIYQLLFYSSQLNTDICGLIYPSNNFYDPIPLDIMGVDIKFFLISINMDAEFENRKNEFVKNIEFCLKYT